MCGIVGVSGVDNACDVALRALVALQGRGYQAAGVSVFQADDKLWTKKSPGLIRNLRAQIEIGSISGKQAIAHTRYGTFGVTSVLNAQPFVSRDQRLAIAHNGEFISAQKIKAELISQGVDFEATSDSEVLLRLLENSQSEGVINRVLSALNRLVSAFSVIISWDDFLIGACDLQAHHPLSLGNLKNGGYIFASEDCAFKNVEASKIKDLKAGQVIVISPEQEVQTFWLKNNGSAPNRCAHCSFNFSYTARPDSVIWGRSVTQVRKPLGLELFYQLKSSDELPMVDLIIPVLDSGRTHTLSFAKAYSHWRLQKLLESEGIDAWRRADLDFCFPFDFGINRAHDSDRNFQESTQSERDDQISLKHSGDQAVVRGKRLIVGDDTLVRATTSRRIVTMLKDLGATEVHFYVFAPPVIESCPYGGTETKEKSRLMAANRSPEEIRRFIGADSLQYLSLERYKRVMNHSGEGHCFTCFDGHFPVPIEP